MKSPLIFSTGIRRSVSGRLAAIALALLLSSLPSAKAGFTGVFDLSNWIYDSGGTGASVSLDAGNGTFTLTGSMNGDDVSTYTRFALPDLDANYIISFDWSYSTTDSSPGFDPAGYTDFGGDAVLTDSFGGLTQSGSVSNAYIGGPDFSFFVLADNYSGADGAGSLTISNFNFALADSTWNGSTGGDWTDPANWGGAGLPGPDNAAIIDSGSSILGVDPGATADIDYLVLGSNAGSLTVQNGAVGTSNGIEVDPGGSLTITDAGSSWTTDDSIFVSGAGSSITVTDGASLSSTSIFVDANILHGGSVTITGTGSSWTNPAPVDIGTGTLDILDHAIATTGIVSLGITEDSVSAVTVSNEALWTISNLAIGEGTTTMDIDSGGKVDILGGMFAGGADPLSPTNPSVAITIDGVGSEFSVAGGFSLLKGASITVQAGGTLTSATDVPFAFTTLEYGSSVTVTGVGSSWNNPSDLNIHTGTVDLLDHAIATTGNTFIGYDDDSTAQVTVSGKAHWTADSISLTAGTGTLLVNTGGKVDVLGDFAAGGDPLATVVPVSTITIDGQDPDDSTPSELSVAGNFTLGAGANVTVSGGGTLNTATDVASFPENSIRDGGAVTVTGTGSSWSTPSYLTVDIGTIDVLDHATVTTCDTDLGNSDDSVALATVSGGAHWTAEDLSLTAGTGTLLVNTGGKVEVLDGLSAGGDPLASVVPISTITVDGANSELSVARNFTLQAGANVTVSDGGTMTTATDLVSFASNSIDFGASVTVTGNGSSWDTPGYLGVYTGTIDLLDGATATMADVNLAIFSDNIARVTVSGGSQWTADNLSFSSGQGTLLVNTGGKVVVNQDLHTVNDITSDITITVDGAGSDLNVTGNFTLDHGTTATISNGASLETSTDPVNFVSNTIDNGATLILEDSGTTWTTPAQVSIGNYDQGTLTVRNGATAEVGSLTTGYDGAANGTITIEDWGSKLTSGTNGGTDVIGFFGASTVTVQNGGRYDTSDLIIGEANHGNGSSLVVTGKSGIHNSQLNVANTVKIGDYGDGSLTVSAGGIANTGSGEVAFGVNGAAGVIGTATVTDAGSQWNITGHLGIGSYIDSSNFSPGTVTIKDGGAISISDDVRIAAGSVLNIGDGGLSGSLSATNIYNGGTVAFNHTDNITVAIPIDDDLTPGIVTKAGSGTVKLTSVNSYSGGTTITGGTVLADNTIDPLHPEYHATGSGLVDIGSGATLGGTGSVASVSVGGTISPGDGLGTPNAVGTLSSGDESWSPDGTYVWQLNDASDGPGAKGVTYDWLDIDGVLSINSSSDGSHPFVISVNSLTFANIGGVVANFDPNTSYTWTIATAGGGIMGVPEQFLIQTSGFFNQPNSGRFGISISPDGHDLNLTYTAIPEPRTWGAMMGGGLLLLVLLRRRRRSMGR